MKTPSAETISQVEAMYPNTTGDAFDIFSKDGDYACHAYQVAKTFGSNAYRYSMSISPATHGQDQFYYFFEDVPNTPVSDKQIARRLQVYFRRFILQSSLGGGECDDGGVLTTPKHWPSYSSSQRWMNITEDGFELVVGEPDQSKRCDFLLDLIADPKNGF